MGGYLAVQQGSKFPPQFIHLVYKPDLTVGSQKPIKLVLIGKGLTFDSGGYNLKVFRKVITIFSSKRLILGWCV